jgi:hypothetical protein
MKHHIGLDRLALVCLLAAGFAFAPRPALAAFHVMEIEQVVGGVGTDTSAQAIQLAMRAVGQNFVVGNGSLIAHDAAGNNPVTISTFATLDGGAAANPASGSCGKILLVTPSMRAKASPPITGAFDMIPIPASYLPAGSLTFEGLGSVWWRVSWGAYTGPQTVSAGTNDADGNTAPPFASALPSTTNNALKFLPGCPLSVSNATDYSLTTGGATLLNNAGGSFAVLNLLPVPALSPTAKLVLAGVLGLAVVTFGFLRRRAPVA